MPTDYIGDNIKIMNGVKYIRIARPDKGDYKWIPISEASGYRINPFKHSTLWDKIKVIVWHFIEPLFKK